MNKIEGMWDYEKLESLLGEFDTEDIEFAGFTKAEIESMFADCEEPDFTESENEEPEKKPTTANTAEQEDDTLPQGNEKCVIYLSFPTKESAEKWLAENGIEAAYGKKPNINIKMEGVDYGTAQS